MAAVVRGMLGNDAEADDVGQETFILFYRSLDKFRGESAVATYLTRIAINQSLKALNRRRTWLSRFLAREHDDDEFGVQPAETVTGPLDEKERAVRVREALATLTPEYRAVVVLRVMEEYSTRETADMLGIAEGTVMSRLSRAMKKLEPLLGSLR